jgi:hypothetical protein
MLNPPERNNEKTAGAPLWKAPTVVTNKHNTGKLDFMMLF